MIAIGSSRTSTSALPSIAPGLIANSTASASAGRP
jgi:hypothetical protein